MIARVFLTKTRMSPDDEHVYFGPPESNTPKYDEVHISATFTWDLSHCGLANYWEKYGAIKVGGPACGDPGGEFVPGRYLKKGITITSRGCPWNCPFCYVPKREGKIRELKIHNGNIIQDNNLLACSKSHLQKVFQMLRKQRAIEFKGGLDCRLMNAWIFEELCSLKIKSLWFAYDTEEILPSLQKSAEKLRSYFPRNKLRCYVLIGYAKDTIEAAEARLKTVWELGFLPFAMLYQTKVYTKNWHELQRNFSRPAITKSIMKGDLK
jgi:hypothetical protein